MILKRNSYENIFLAIGLMVVGVTIAFIGIAVQMFSSLFFFLDIGRSCVELVEI